LFNNYIIHILYSKMSIGRTSLRVEKLSFSFLLNKKARLFLSLSLFFLWINQSIKGDMVWQGCIRKAKRCAVHHVCTKLRDLTIDELWRWNALFVQFMWKSIFAKFIATSQKFLVGNILETLLCDYICFVVFIITLIFLWMYLFKPRITKSDE